MIQRIVTCNIRPERRTEFRKALDDKFIPTVKKQSGFVDLIEAVDPETGYFACSTFWKTQEDVRRYDEGLFQEIATALTPFLLDEPEVQTLQVETSTAYKIAAGRSAAA